MNAWFRSVTQAALAATILVAVISPASATAPDPVLAALEAQRDLGWEPCEPEILPLYDQDQDKVGAADNGIQSGHCAIWIRAGLPADLLETVAWHEVCHLSTVHQIFSQPVAGMEDPAHKHPLFKACLAQGPAETGGY